jgi:hypothetical protein
MDKTKGKCLIVAGKIDVNGIRNRLMQASDWVLTNTFILSKHPSVKKLFLLQYNTLQYCSYPINCNINRPCAAQRILANTARSQAHHTVVREGFVKQARN